MNFALLLPEARKLLASASNDLSTRKAHPSFGITKAGIGKRLQVAEGMLRAAALLTGRLNMATLSTAMLDRDGDDDVLYELAHLRMRLENELKGA